MKLLDYLKEYGHESLGYPSEKTLEAMKKVNPNLEEDFKTLISCAVRSMREPLAHEPAESKGYYKPIPELYVPYVQLMISNRYSKSLSISDAIAKLKTLGYDVKSAGQISNIWNRAETKLGLKDKRRQSEKDKKAKAEYRKKIGKKKIQPNSEAQKKALEKANKAKAEMAKIRKAEKEAALAKRRLARVAAESEKPKEVLEEAMGITAENAKEVKEQLQEQGKKVLYEPTPKQAEFHSAGEDIVLYGGAAGGGKSYAMLVDALRYAMYEDYRGLIIRRTSPMLKELISVSRSLYPKAFPGAKYNKSENVWYFPSGGTIQFGYLDRPEDLDNYQGLPYSYIGFDEIQHQRSDEGFIYLLSRLRSANPNIKCYIRASANPGGSPWVKETFIDPAEPNTTFYHNGLSYRFIPARLEDNPHLDTPQGDEQMSPYRKMLMALPEVKRKQLLEGDWTAGDDAMFAFSPLVHVTDELPPLHWSVINGLDYGYKDPACSLWGAVCPKTGKIVIYQELECIEHVHEDWAKAVIEAEGYLPQGVERVIDHSVFNQTGHTGPGVREKIAKLGLTPKPADRNREAGWNQIHERLMIDPETGEPNILVHSSCKVLIDQIMSARRNEKKPDDIDDKRIKSKGRVHHWDMLDALRYLLMARPNRLTIQERNMRYKENAAYENRHAGYFS